MGNKKTQTPPLPLDDIFEIWKNRRREDPSLTVDLRTIILSANTGLQRAKARGAVGTGALAPAPLPVAPVPSPVASPPKAALLPTPPRTPAAIPPPLLPAPPAPALLPTPLKTAGRPCVIM